MSILVIDVGTSSVRATVLRPDGTLAQSRQLATPPARPAAGVVELDATAIAKAATHLGKELAEHGDIDAVGITTQRSSSVLWDRLSGTPVAASLSWQDIRTTGQCLMLRASGLRLQPSQSASKLAWQLDVSDPERARDLCFGTLESYLAFTLSGGNLHVTDASNAAITGLTNTDGTDWDETALEILRVPRQILPRIVDSTGLHGAASALPGAPMIAALIGDQQASLLGQGCISRSAMKATFGTGGMLDCCLGELAEPPARGAAATFPIICWRIEGRTTWGAEAIMLSAGSCIEWLRNGIGLIADAAETDAIAGSVRDSGGVFFVPALGGLGTPLWDYGARGTLTGLSDTTTRAEIIRAVLEGIAHRARDLLDAIENDTGLIADEVHLDGGMSANSTFVQLVADALGRRVVRSSHREATTLGAGLLAGLATGYWRSLEDASGTIAPGLVVEPARPLDRDRWLDARTRALRTVPALSALSF